MGLELGAEHDKTGDEPLIKTNPNYVNLTSNLLKRDWITSTVNIAHSYLSGAIFHPINCINSGYCQSIHEDPPLGKGLQQALVLQWFL